MIEFTEGKYRKRGEPMISPIERTTLSRNILGKLIIEIKKGTWKPGCRIPKETELAKAFSVSRNSIRETLKTLNNMGILESRPGSGTFLTKDAMRKIFNSELIENGYKYATLKEITEIRILLESQSAYWAAKRASDEDLQELREILEKSQQSSEWSIKDQDKLHFHFHEAVIRMSRNSLVGRLLASIHAEIEAERSQYEVFPDADQVEIIRNQEDVINRILAREPGKAREAMEKHLKKGFSLLVKAQGKIESEKKLPEESTLCGPDNPQESI